MFTLLVVLHILVSLFLIFVVLIQGGRGAELGAAFGGSSQTLFGGRGAATFLNKLTTAVAIVFMLTSLSLTLVSLKTTGSVVRGQAPATERAPEKAPALPTVPLPNPPPKTPAEPAK